MAGTWKRQSEKQSSDKDRVERAKERIANDDRFSAVKGGVRKRSLIARWCHKRKFKMYEEKDVLKFFGIVSLGARIKPKVFRVFMVRGTGRQV